MASIQLNTLMRIINDLNGVSNEVKKESFLTRKLNEESLKELKSIKSELNLLPHSEQSGGGSCE